MKRRFEDILVEHLDAIGQLAPMAGQIEQVAEQMIACLRGGGRIFFMGNGGSAADSQHLAAEFVGRFQLERQPLPSIALTTDTSVLTAIANDYGYESVFERQIAGLARPGDVIVGISTSGNSGNVLRGIAKARELGAYTVGMTGGKGGALVAACDDCLCVPSPRAARIQEAHILIGHALCELVEETLAEIGE